MLRSGKNEEVRRELPYYAAEARSRAPQRFMRAPETSAFQKIVPYTKARAQRTQLPQFDLLARPSGRYVSHFVSRAPRGTRKKIKNGSGQGSASYENTHRGDEEGIEHVDRASQTDAPVRRLSIREPSDHDRFHQSRLARQLQ